MAIIAFEIGFSVVRTGRFDPETFLKASGPGAGLQQGALAEAAAPEAVLRR
jgi:hypothetical protein